MLIISHSIGFERTSDHLLINLKLINVDVKVGCRVTNLRLKAVLMMDISTQLFIRYLPYWNLLILLLALYLLFLFP